MPTRLTPLDTSLLHLEDSTTQLHGGSVMVFDAPSEGFDYERLISLISRRISHVPRYRQRVRFVPFGVGNPVWVDDERFDITYHVRRSALPRPGSDEQLEELVARILPRPLDRERPLWEVYLVEGLADDRFAIISKTHHALVDGIHAVDIAHIIVDGDQDAPVDVVHHWRPTPEPTDAELLVSAFAHSVRTPAQFFETMKTGANDMRKSVEKVSSAISDVVSTVARLSSSAPTSPLVGEIGRARRYVMVGTDLEDYRKIRTRLTKGTFADDVTINDVVLATVTGALRSWLMTRGETVTASTAVRAMVPVSIHGDDPTTADPSTTGRELKACFVDLPVGEPVAPMRLHQIAFAMRQQMEGGTAVSADTLTGLGGFAPPTMHALGARLGGAVNRRLYNVAITNVPGPQVSLYCGGAQMVSSYPIMPLVAGHTLSIGLTSYDGGVYYGLYADRDAIPDVDVLGHALVESLQELLETPTTRRRATSKK